MLTKNDIMDFFQLKRKIVLLTNLGFAFNTGNSFTKITASTIDSNIVELIDRGHSVSSALYITKNINIEEKRFLQNFEKNGSLQSGLSSLKKIIEQKLNFSQSCFKEFLYPLFMGVIMVIIVTAFNFFINGTFSAILNFFKSSFIFLLFLYILINFISSYLSKEMKIIKELFKLSSFIKSGVSFEFIKESFNIETADNIADICKKAGFSQEIVSIISTAEVSGQLEPALEKYIKYYEEITETKFKKTASISGLIVYMSIIAVYAIKILSSYTAIYN